MGKLKFIKILQKHPYLARVYYHSHAIVGYDATSSSFRLQRVIKEHALVGQIKVKNI